MPGSIPWVTVACRAGIAAAGREPFYWRVEFTDDANAVIHTFERGLAGEYTETGVVSKELHVTAPWPITLDVRRLTG